MTTDRQEQNNLAAEQPERLNRMRVRWRELAEQMNVTPRRGSNASKNSR